MKKKNIIIVLVLLVIILVVGFFVLSNKTEQKNSTNNNVPQVQVQLQNGAVVAQPSNNSSQGSLTVCLDKCGDGICQTNPDCKPGANCLCPETKQECPQDCK